MSHADTVVCQICNQKKALREVLPAEMVRDSVVATIRKKFPKWSSKGHICYSDLNKFRIEHDKFGLILKSMDANEQKVLKAVKEQDGITQSTLKFRTDLSKSKVSQILTDFEKKHLITRELKGKTYSVHLMDNF